MEQYGTDRSPSTESTIGNYIGFYTQDLAWFTARFVRNDRSTSLFTGHRSTAPTVNHYDDDTYCNSTLFTKLRTLYDSGLFTD
jgi:hypothetical protein